MPLGKHHVRVRTIAVCLSGVAVRVALVLLGLQPKLESALELVVASTSWERAQEGLFLGNLGLSHYAGGTFSGSPLMLAAAAFCAMMPAGMQGIAAVIVFSIFDVIGALFLRMICLQGVAVESGEWETQLEKYMDEDSKPPSRRTSSSTEKNTGSPTNESTAWKLPDIVLAAYLLNPIFAAQCAALSGDVLGRVLPLAALAAAGARRPGFTAAALAAATCLWRFYAASLMLPAALILGQSSCEERNSAEVPSSFASRTDDTCTGGVPSSMGVTESSSVDSAGKRAAHRDASNHKRRSGQDATCVPVGSRSYVGGADAAGSAAGSVFDPRYFTMDVRAFLRLCATFLIWCAAVLGACWLATSGSWAFLGAAARGQLLCEDLTPNAGLYWYLFAEVFPRFRGFFRVLFLSQPYIYVLPATLRLGMFPEALAALLLSIFGLFQPYPTLGDPVLAACLFLCYPRTSARMRLVIPVGMVALVPSFLLPTMRHLWLQAGTGNANFYYFQTVVLNVLLCVFVLQFAAALVKRRKALAVAFEKRRVAENVPQSPHT